MSKMKKDTVIGLVLIAFGLFILYFSFEIKIMKTASFSVSSAFFPRICAALLMLLGAMLSWGSMRNAKKTTVDQACEEAKADVLTKAALVRMAVTLLALILFVALLHRLGFIICSVLMQSTLMITLAPEDQRSTAHIVRYVLISLCTALVVYLVFVKAFNLILPAGVLKGVL